MIAVHSLLLTLALAGLAMLPGDPAQALKAAKKSIAVSIANGMLTCSTDEDAGRAVPTMSGGLYLNVKQMHATGAEKGGAALIANGAQPMVQFSVGPNSSGRKGIWFINYQAKQGPSLQVTFDGVTGKFEQAIPG